MSYDLKLEILAELDLSSPIGQLRAVPVRLGPDQPPAVLCAYGADFDVDPYIDMFFFPTDTLKLALISTTGQVLWKKDLGPGVVPGHWFCPIHAFDLDGDGVDEIWFVNNINTQHPLSLNSYRLERLDAYTGNTTGQWEWNRRGGATSQQSLSYTFRNFIMGGYFKQQPVLLAAQGTYAHMSIYAYNRDLSLRWEHRIEKDAPGARGSHMWTVTDLDGDGVQELMWGERCLELDAGRELFCADRDTYRGHSDVIQPVLDRSTGRWFIFTARESDGQVSPRVALFDSRGNRVWGAVDQGHMDMGWVAHFPPPLGLTAMAIRIGHKTCGPDGRFHQDRTEFVFNCLNGTPVTLPFPVYQTLPVDLNGDGYHELVRGIPGSSGEVLDHTGKIHGAVGGTIALARKLVDFPGEQLLAYYPDGKVKIWADRNACDSPIALGRYASSYYQTNKYALGGI